MLFSFSLHFFSPPLRSLLVQAAPTGFLSSSRAVSLLVHTVCPCPVGIPCSVLGWLIHLDPNPWVPLWFYQFLNLCSFWVPVTLSLVAQMVKHLPAMRETWVRSLDWEDLLEKKMATHSSILAWEIPWTEEPGGLQSMGLQRIRHDWARTYI